MGEVGRVDPLVCPAAHSIGNTKCDVSAVAYSAHKERILAAARPPSENHLLDCILRLAVEAKEILFRVEAASFGRK